MKDTQTDELGRKRLVGELAKVFEGFADRFEALSEMGMSPMDIALECCAAMNPATAKEVWGRLAVTDTEGQTLAALLSRLSRLGPGHAHPGPAHHPGEDGCAPTERDDYEPAEEYIEYSANSRLIRRLLIEAKAASAIPDQAPAFQCAVILRGWHQPLQGSLSETFPEHGLRMMCPDPSGEFIEHFFDYMDVVVLAIPRKVTVSPSLIIPS